MKKSIDECSYVNCYRFSDLIYLSKYGVCQYHWNLCCDKSIKYTYKKLGVSQADQKENNKKCGCEKSMNPKKKFF